MKAVEKYNPNHECSFSTFAYICIRNSVIEGIRRRSKYKEEPSDPMLFDQNIYNDEPVALDMSLLNELLEVDDEDENDYLDKEILKLYYLNDLTHEAIGSKFGISKFSVSRKIKRAIKKIRSCHKELLNENKYECC
jgi:RNA polymerase sigma factor (sigma-70 family)